jgi:ubiquinol-cytochrome c reductase cytochrome b subunit
MTTGLFLAMHYNPHRVIAFGSLSSIIRNYEWTWAVRIFHSNGARLFFMCLYIHIARGIYYGSYKNLIAWKVGFLIFVLRIATAFIGYVLPWGQISFWGTSVITSLFGIIPKIGKKVIHYLWIDISISRSTLSRFYTLHFLLPFILTALTLLHLFYIHEKGSHNPLGFPRDADKLKFSNYFLIKDLLGFIVGLFLVAGLVCWQPWLLNDSDNFIPANNLKTPAHIQPEWYFLFAYAILRRIPNKTGGILAIMFAVLVILIIPIIKFNSKGYLFNPERKLLFWGLIALILLLSWVGAQPVATRFTNLGQKLTILYFIWFAFIW